MDPILSTAAANPSLPLALDHLVVAARTLDEGEAWLRSRLGRPLVAGGSHAGFGTHNRLLRLGPDCYLELIAHDPAQAPAGLLFGLDQEPVKDALSREPLLLHTVFRVLAPATLAVVLPRLGYDAGVPTPMSRGDLHWQITIAPKGRLAGDGLLPTLIDWGAAAHPCARLPASGIRLQGLRLQGPADVIAAFPQLAATGATSGEARIKLESAAAPCSTISAELWVDGKQVIIESRLPRRDLA
jgi:hypothetical protein